MVAWTPDLATPVTAKRARTGIDGRPVPRLRGRLHEIMTVPAFVAGVAITAQAPDATSRVALSLYTVCVTATLASSAFYHCHARTPATKLAARRVDHAMIFAAIAGTHTAFWTLLAPRWLALAVLVPVWGIAIAGGVEKFRSLGYEVRTRWGWMYPGLGWVALPMLPMLVESGGPLVLGLVLGGGCIFTLGAVLLHLRRLDLWPPVWGYHESWHVMVTLGLICHGVGVVTLL